MKIGIVGLPNVGKSTLFNALTNGSAEASNYPFCTIDSNIGVVSVPDDRLVELGKLYNTKKIVPTTIEFVDIAGLVKGASKGEGLGNKFLSHIREVDAICHVVRCFDNENITHVNGVINPLDDIETINLELILADLEVIERALIKQKKAAKADKKELAKVETLEKIKKILEKGKFPNQKDFKEDEWKWLKSFQLITLKPVMYIANITEDEINQENNYVKELKNRINNNDIISISAEIENEISQLDSEEKKEFLDELGINESGLDKVIKTAYNLLDLQSFLTAGPDECRAWTIKVGTKAPQAAGKVHSDMERGFIRAEVTNYNDLIKYGSETKTKELGLTRIEGKDYIIQEDDVVFFRFNV